MTRQWGTANAKIEVVLAEILDLLKVLSFKPGAGQNIALNALPGARNCAYFFLLSQISQLHFFPSKYKILCVLKYELGLFSCDLMTCVTS